MVATRSMPETRDAPMDEPPETPQQPRCVAGALEPFRQPENNTLRGARWSPDGLCLLTASEDRHLRLFELPEQLQSHEGLEAAGSASEGADRPRQSELPNPQGAEKNPQHNFARSEFTAKAKEPTKEAQKTNKREPAEEAKEPAAVAGELSGREQITEANRRREVRAKEVGTEDARQITPSTVHSCNVHVTACIALSERLRCRIRN